MLCELSVAWSALASSRVHYDCTCIMPIYYLLCNNSTNKMAASLEHSRFIELGVHSDSI